MKKRITFEIKSTTPKCNGLDEICYQSKHCASAKENHITTHIFLRYHPSIACDVRLAHASYTAARSCLWKKTERKTARITITIKIIKNVLCQSETYDSLDAFFCEIVDTELTMARSECVHSNPHSFI